MGAVAGLVGELRAVVDRLCAVDAGSLGAAELHELVVGAVRERSRLVAAMSGQLVGWESSGGWRSDGSLNAGLALGRDTRSDHRRARFELRRARLLERLAVVRAAVLDGRLSIDHVDLLVKVASPARMGLLVAHQELLVGQLAGLSLFDEARRTVRYWADHADDVLGTQRDRLAPSTVYLSRLADSGEAILSGCLAPVDAEIVAGELDRLAREIRREDRANGVTRSRAQCRAAALVRMASRSVSATGVTARPLFQVVVGDETARRLCELASGSVVHPDDLAPHVDSAVVESFLFDGPSTVIAKTSKRLFTGALRRAIQVRDRRCQHVSGCPTPAVACDVDHRRPAARGGPTSQFNGHIECVAHNRLEHLHDDPVEQPERPIDRLDELRCRIRWRILHDDDVRDDEPDEDDDPGDE